MSLYSGIDGLSIPLWIAVMDLQFFGNARGYTSSSRAKRGQRRERLLSVHARDAARRRLCERDHSDSKRPLEAPEAPARYFLVSELFPNVVSRGEHSRPWVG